MNANVSLYLETQKIATFVQMASHRVYLEGEAKPGYLCTPHLELVQDEPQIETATLLTRLTRGRFACDLCRTGHKA